MAINFQQKRRTAATWTSENPTLLAGQIGLETDTGLVKYGDGSTAWISLAYAPVKYSFAETAAPAVTDDINSEYNVGSQWIDVTNDRAYISVDSTVGAAVWVETTAGAGGGDPDQNLFSTIAGDAGTNPVADTATDTLTIAGGTGLDTSGNSGTDTLTVNITNAGVGAAQIAAAMITGQSAAAAFASGDKFLIVSGGALEEADFDDLPSGSGDPDQNLFLNVAGDSGTNAVADTTTDTLTIAGGTGLASVGDSGSDTVTVNLDINSLVADTPVAADTLAFEDTGGGDDNKATITVLSTVIDHDTTVNFVADEHVAHAGVTITAGIGLAGGGTIAATRTIDLDINSLTADTPVAADTIVFEDTGGGDDNKATITVLSTVIDHDTTNNFVADEHIAHAGVTITAGAGMTGGGTIAATRTLDVIGATNGGLLVNANDMQLDINSLAADTPVAADTIAFEDVGGGLDNKATITVLSTVIDHDTTVNFVAAEHVASTAAETLTNKDHTSQTNKRRLHWSMTIEDPVAADDISWFRHESAFTVTEMNITTVGSSTPSVTVDVRHHTDRSNAGNALITTPTASTAAANSAETTGHVITSFNDATVPLDSIVWIEFDAKSGTVDEVNITIYATED